MHPGYNDSESILIHVQFSDTIIVRTQQIMQMRPLSSNDFYSGRNNIRIYVHYSELSIISDMTISNDSKI
jgi:hypothetical protein